MALGGGWGKRMSKGLHLQSALPIAIDFGVGSLKVLQVNAGPPLSVVAAACVETPEDLLGDPVKRFEFQALALPRVVKAGGFTSRRAACAIPAAQGYCKHMQLASGNGAAIAAQVRGAVSAQIGCDPSALIFQHLEVGPVTREGGAGKTEVICMAASRDLIERFLSAVRSARLDLVGVHSEVVALIKAMSSIGPQGDNASAASLYLDIGAGVTKVAIAQGARLLFARPIELGGRHLDHAIARQTRTDLAEARQIRLGLRDLSAAAGAAAAGPASGGGAAVAVAEADYTTRQAVRAVTEPLEILTDEVAMCLRYYESLFPGTRPARVTFLGGEARHVALCARIARSLKLPALTGDPMAGVARTGKEPARGVDLSGAQPGWAMVLGLALCPMDL